MVMVYSRQRSIRWLTCLGTSQPCLQPLHLRPTSNWASSHHRTAATHLSSSLLCKTCTGDFLKLYDANNSGSPATDRKVRRSSIEVRTGGRVEPCHCSDRADLLINRQRNMANVFLRAIRLSSRICARMSLWCWKIAIWWVTEFHGIVLFDDI